MPWKPLPDDVPLDHEALTPAEPSPAVADVPAATDGAGVVPAAAAASPQLTELPAGAQLDPEAPPSAPGIAAGATPTVAKKVNPTVTEQGFADTMEPAKTYHSQLSEDELKEYESFFTDPSKPPSPEALRRWFHEKTGAYMGNADEVVDHFRKTGEYSTTQNFTLPTQAKGAAGSFNQHVGNSILGDWGAEISAPFGALGLGSEDRPDVFNSDASFGDLVGLNADITRAQLDRNTEEHPYASAGGELVGLVPAAVAGGAAARLARVDKLGQLPANLAKGLTGGVVYGSGAAGPGNRAQGAGMGAALAPTAALGVKLPAMGYSGVRSVLEGAPGTARKIIAKAITDDANTPASVGADIAAAHANDVPMALGDTGENVRGLLAASSRSSGMGRTITRDALETRQAELGDRVVGHIERDLGPIANPHQLADSMMAKAHNDAAPLYNDFYSQPSVSDPAVDALLERPSMRKALKNAYRIAQEEGRDPEQLGLRVGEDGNVQLEKGPTLSAAEAQKANPNRFRLVDIPDEFDELRVRTITTPNGRKVKFRGPIDMTQRLRMMGGLRDQGGELSHIGITNAPRKLKFGRNEQFLGRLIDNDKGMTLDDATHALWEDGYFPEFSERPTPNDLLERLREEHLGTARYFDPADAAEVDAFNAAQGARGALEEAAAEGRPFADDMTTPAGEADAIARAGPVSEGRRPDVGRTLSPQTLDYIKRGMDDVVESYRDPTTGKLVLDTEGRAVNNTLRQFIGLIDKRYPSYAQARAAYAGPVKGIAAMNEGRKALNMTADDLEAKIRDMTPFEKDMFALGARRAMAELVRSKGDTADVVNALVGTGKKRAMLGRLFGDRKQFQRFVETLSQEREGWRSFKQALLGSPTAANVADDATLEAATTAAELVAHGGLPVTTALRKTVQFLGREVSEKTKQQIAALLSNTDPSAIRKLAEELRNRAAKRGLRTQRIDTISRQVGKATAIAGAQQAQ